MSNPSDYQPPKVWKWDTENGGAFVKINRPTAGVTHEKDLPIGETWGNEFDHCPIDRFYQELLF